MRDSEAEVYFFRGIVRYLRGKHQGALEDVSQAIEKAEDNVPQHYVIRGLCQALAKDYQEALQDFSIAIQPDEENRMRTCIGRGAHTCWRTHRSA